MSVGQFSHTSHRDDGALGDLLNRVLILTSQFPGELNALHSSLRSSDLGKADGEQSLLAASIVHQIGDRIILLRIELFRRYMQQHLR